MSDVALAVRVLELELPSNKLVSIELVKNVVATYLE
jgi:hypothetical protein